MRSTLLFAFALLLLVFTGCREEGDLVTTTTGSIPPPTIITATVTTVVINTSGDPVSDVSITGLGVAGTQNPDGSISIDASQLSTDGTVVTVTSPGHWPERRVLMPAGDGEFRETFVMEPKVKAGDIDPSSGGIIQIAENFSVELPANTVVTKEDGTPYDGVVEVYVNHDAPESQEEMLNSMGNALAQMPDGSMAALESYGMMDIALESPSGESLTLDEATPAEVRMPIEAGTEMRGPDQVPFWILDPAGFWLPAGFASLAPGCYVVYITSSGTCNVDVPHPVTRLCGRFVDAGGFPLTHSPFSVQVVGGMYCGASRIDCDGEFCINVAAGVPLAIIVTDPCTEEQTIIAIDSIPQNTLSNVGDIVVDLSNTAFYANVTDCSGAGLPNIALTEIWANGYGGNNGEYFAPRADGETVVSLVNCDEDQVLVQAFTSDYRAASPVYRRDAEDSTPQSFVVCGDLDADESFSLTIDGQEIPITELAPVYWPNNETFSWQVRAAGTFEGEEYSLFFKFSDPTVGEFAGEDAFAAVYRLEPGQEYGEGRVYVDPTQEIGLVGTMVSAEGDVFEGTFEASMNLQNDAAQTVEAVNVPVTATFRIKL